jgi:hypothetical protein
VDSGGVADALPSIDGSASPDVVRNDCPDAGATVIYVVTEQTELFSFYPPDATFKHIGNIVCPAPLGTTPFSMAVDRKGVAYVLYNDGRLYRVSTATAACIATTFETDQQGFHTFGMGYATNELGPTETLYIAGDSNSGIGSPGLGSIDTSTFGVTRIGDFDPPIARGELTGTGAGRLFAFYTKAPTQGSFIGEIEPTSGRVIAETPLPTVTQGSGWAFAFWGGDFYTFTAPDPSRNSRVTRYRPTDGSVREVASISSLIVGAGVSTCAPE